ncbi:hypothetical protein AVEN_269260-1 [Araneus ventricosus]|uniref:Uncharacterized protein n=1 Tax=Araneus ventricosus TaxID=182803 RepID=A0A4Y2J811_ARAVE|nr:hypothetical protein AVEN_269260-1 [Araneus ventricosus]
MPSVWPPSRHNKRQPRVMYHDTTSGFCGKGKLQAVQLFNRSKYLQDIPEIFNNPKSTYTDIERAGERFIFALYSNPKKEGSSLNKMRYDCFNQFVGQASSAILLSKLPPTTETAHQYCPRTFHQVQTWQGESLNPSSWGWKLVNKSLTLIYTIKGPKSAKIVSLITYGCNKGRGKKCKSVRVNLRCNT